MPYADLQRASLISSGSADFGNDDVDLRQIQSFEAFPGISWSFGSAASACMTCMSCMTFKLTPESFFEN
jgi:hypothetical protein